MKYILESTGILFVIYGAFKKNKKTEMGQRENLFKTAPPFHPLNSNQSKYI